MKGLVIKKNANLFSVEVNGEVKDLLPRGTLKKDGIYVGDVVEFNETIEKVYARKNLMIRPPMANLDKIFIVISPSPQPDLLLVDKMILCCFVKGITPILVINKEDISSQEFLKNIKKIYKNVAKIIVCSAKKQDVEKIKSQIKGICAFAGQSAVGKSSLINELLGERKAQIGDLSKKIERGKQTTRMVSLFSLGQGYLADTAGFSSLDVNMLIDIQLREVDKYYPDFLPYLSECKYRSCNHKNPKECGLLKNLDLGNISELRYKNYLKIIDSLAQKKR